MSSQYYKVTAYASVPQRHEVEVTLPLAGPQGPVGPQGPAGASTGDVLTTTGDILYRGATAAARLGIGTTGQVLKVSGGLPIWANEAGGGVTSVTGTAPIVSSGGTTPAISISAATTSAAGSMSSADKTKLDGIATGATANSSDATLLARANHTGTQAHTTITGLGDLATQNAATPPTLGGTTPAAATFTNLTANTRVNLPNTNGTTAGDLYRNANTLRYRDSTNTERLLLNASDNLANLSSAAISRTNLGVGSSDAVTFGSIQNTPIGSTTASTAAFTTLSASTSLTLGTSGILSGGTNTIEQRNTTSAQTFRIYNTVSGAADADLERLFLRWSTNIAQIGTERTGTGSARSLELSVNGNRRFFIATDGGVGIGSTTGLLASNGLYVDVPANSSSLTSQNVTIRGSTTVSIDNGGNNVLRISGDRLNFGGTTSSFPALKRSSTALQVRLADDSAFAPLECASLTLTGGTVTASAPVLDATQTWNNSGTTFTALRLNATNTASASGSLLMDLQTGGTSQFSVRRDGRVNCNSITVGGVSTMDTGAGQLLIRNAVIGWDNNAVMIQNTDLQLFRDAADTLAQRRTTNPQTFRIYNTVSGTNNVNFERANFRWASNEFIIDAEAGGTGTALRGIKIGSATSSLLGFYGATPVTQRAAIADATDAATTQARLNDLLAAMRSLGLIAT